MAISTLNDLLGAQRQSAMIGKVGQRAAIAANPSCVFDLAGTPGAGTLAAANTASGVVPTDADAGYPTLTDFPAGALGYITRVQFTSNQLSTLAVYDRLFLAGAYSFNAANNLAGQPSYAARIAQAPYRETEIWVECVTAFTGIPVFTIGYTNEAGVAGRSTGAFSAGAAPILGQCFQLPFQAGDGGVAKIESVTCTGATAGTFNVMVLRPVTPLMRVGVANWAETYDLLRANDQVFQTSALYLIVTPDAATTGRVSVRMQVSAK